MLALVAAAALVAAFPPDRAPDQTHVRDGVTTQVWRNAPLPAARETPNLAENLPEHCRAMFQHTQRPTPRQRPGGAKLGDLPPADHHLLVDRRLYGCPVPTIVRYGADEGAGAPRYRAPPRPEGARGNRR